MSFYIMSRGSHPYGIYPKGDVNILEGNYDLLAVKDTVACDLVEHMLAKNPSDRPSAEELLR